LCPLLSFFFADPYRALGMASRELPDSAITASSTHTSVTPYRSRLYSTEYGNHESWASASLNTNQWLQIDTSMVRFLTAVATQGRHTTTYLQWVRSYWLSYSNDTTTFTEYKDQNQVKKVSIMSHMFLCSRKKCSLF